jgi:hypothetical protein
MTEPRQTAAGRCSWGVKTQPTAAGGSYGSVLTESQGFHNRYKPRAAWGSQPLAFPCPADTIRPDPWNGPWLPS